MHFNLSVWFEHLFFNGGRVDFEKEGAEPKTCVTVIGSGGKTSLIWHLAKTLLISPGKVPERCRRILVTPTAKMLAPPSGEKLYDRYADRNNYRGRDGTDFFYRGLKNPVRGITLAGSFNKVNSKLETLPPEELEAIAPFYDLVLMEGDGSRGLPLKAWADYEPVVPDFTDVTIGMLATWPLGMPVSEKHIHRLPQFLALTGMAEGEKLKMEHMAKIITGLFAKACGKKILFFNQAESEDSLIIARELTERLPEQFRSSLSGIIAGSVREDKIIEFIS